MATTLQIQFTPAISSDDALGAFAPAVRPFTPSGTGGSSLTRTTTIVASMTEVQWFDSTDAHPMAWITGYAKSAFVLAGQIDFASIASESASSVNVGLRMKLYKIPHDQGDGVAHIGTFSRSGEIATSFTAYTWNGTPATPVPFAVNDRLLLKGFFYPQGGTAGAGTASVRESTSGADHAITLAETVVFTTDPTPRPTKRFRRLGERAAL